MPGLEIDLTLYNDEKELLAALKGGDLGAYTCLVKHFAMLLFQPAMEILGDPDEADAVVQGAFIKACDKLDTFNADSRLGTWLYRIAVNEALMARRRQSSGELIHEQDLADLLDMSAGNALSASSEGYPLSAAPQGELHVVLTRAFEQLPDNLRQVVFLRTIQGLSTAETAEALNLREGTVKVNLHRARQRLRQLLDGYLSAG